MAIRDYLNEDYKELWDSNWRKALNGCADARQAEQIANEKTLLRIMQNSAAVEHSRAVARGATQRLTPPWVA